MKQLGLLLDVAPRKASKFVPPAPAAPRPPLIPEAAADVAELHALYRAGGGAFPDVEVTRARRALLGVLGARGRA